jgi:hypothetical protein
LSNREWIALASHRAWLLSEAEEAFFSFLSDELPIRSAASPISSMRGDRQRPVTALLTGKLGLSLQLRESFTLTRKLILWVGRRGHSY